MAKIISTNDFKNRERYVVFNSNEHSIEEIPALFNNLLEEGDRAFDYANSKEYMFGDDGTYHELSVGSSGSGLPDPTDLADGTALIKVGNEWKTQEGYGYEDGVSIEWDGNTEGRDTIMGYYYRVSDKVYQVDELNGGTMTLHTVSGDEQYPCEVMSFSGGAYGTYIVSAVKGFYEELGGEIPETGTYLMGEYDGSTYVSKVEKISSHTISPSLLPQSESYVVNFHMDDDENITSDKTWDEIVTAFGNGKHISGYLDGIAMQFTHEGFIYTQYLLLANKLICAHVYEDDAFIWQSNSKMYTLTPET